MYIVPVLFNDNRDEMEDEDEHNRIRFVRHEFQTGNPYISDTMFMQKGPGGIGRPFLVVKEESDIPGAKSRCKTELEFKHGISVGFGKPQYHTLEWVRKNFDLDKPKIQYGLPLMPWDNRLKTRWDAEHRPDDDDDVIQIRKKKTAKPKPKRKVVKKKKGCGCK
jgi:hypothetical protein